MMIIMDFSHIPVIPEPLQALPLERAECHEGFRQPTLVINKNTIVVFVLVIMEGQNMVRHEMANWLLLVLH